MDAEDAFDPSDARAKLTSNPFERSSASLAASEGHAPSHCPNARARKLLRTTIEISSTNAAECEWSSDKKQWFSDKKQGFSDNCSERIVRLHRLLSNVG